jgi:ElaB/YqjD/DUF883 family membrane-anchored ribosome-binding protein
MAQHERAYNKPNLDEAPETSPFFTRMREKSEHLEEEVKKYGDNMDKYIKKNPVKSTVIAGVVGLLLGKLLSR